MPSEVSPPVLSAPLLVTETVPPLPPAPPEAPTLPTNWLMFAPTLTSTTLLDWPPPTDWARIASASRPAVVIAAALVRSTVPPAPPAPPSAPMSWLNSSETPASIDWPPAPPPPPIDWTSTPAELSRLVVIVPPKVPLTVPPFWPVALDRVPVC